MKTWISYNWLKVLAIGFVFGAYYLAVSVVTVPFAYYQFMNWIVVGASLVTALQASKQGKMFLMWVFVLVAVVFNPVAPMYFRADVWPIVDAVAGALFVISFIFLRAKNS